MIFLVLAGMAKASEYFGKPWAFAAIYIIVFEFWLHFLFASATKKDLAIAAITFFYLWGFFAALNRLKHTVAIYLLCWGAGLLGFFVVRSSMGVIT